MAKLTLNPAFEALRGKLGDWVHRHWLGKPVVQRAPKRRRRKLTPAQLAHVEQFRVAAREAPATLAANRDACRRLARAWGKSDISIALQACYYHCSIKDLPATIRKSSVIRP